MSCLLVSNGIRNQILRILFLYWLISKLDRIRHFVDSRILVLEEIVKIIYFSSSSRLLKCTGILDMRNDNFNYKLEITLRLEG